MNNYKASGKIVTKNLIKNRWECLYCGDVIESKYQYEYTTCKCGKSSCDGGTSYIRLVGDLDMIQDMCEFAEVWQDGDKIRCIDGSKQKILELGKVYTVDTSINTTDNRVYIKENKRFSFLKSRFKLVEE